MHCKHNTVKQRNTLQVAQKTMVMNISKGHYKVMDRWDALVLQPFVTQSLSKKADPCHHNIEIKRKKMGA